MIDNSENENSKTVDLLRMNQYWDKCIESFLLTEFAKNGAESYYNKCGDGAVKNSEFVIFVR